MSGGTARAMAVGTARILLVEDAETIRVAVESALIAAGHRVLGRPDGSSLERDLASFRPDVVILDVMLPGRDGFFLLNVVRSRSKAGLVIMTARDGVDDRLRGLTSGADDYVVKPFVLAELVARVNALLRRLGKLPTVITVADLVIDPQAVVARRGDTDIALTATEFRLLHYFAENRGTVLSKTQILTAIWGFDAYDPNLVEVNISAVRRKLDAHGPRLLYTVRGIGYVLRDGPP
ncbi:transcriptional regulator [Mycolicibacterium aromaticivorans JS19b1 = JCM 16368]|uniref:Transcriptional regulator n=1 Tax=Mycolicibacterium aromaticivorans JS19b1 = JCM 16368 TaxID=1440774 RepID=A0A064CH37_9MYCO|nr:response regulator transcription factor [Mycolicibacterium aromaticivorans]KDE98981.1 transcriptional regulator [Mycolicibacterium aromaticivorans JS19b1 = JCM 16368]